MLKFGNKEFRNLQEQVYKNMVDIQDVMQGATVLADFGIKVIGQVDDADDLPNPAEYEGEFGDAYMVGTEAPYDFYIFTRAFEGQEEPTWFNLGIFPQPGPQGPQGEAGTPVFPTIRVASETSTLAAGASAHVDVESTGSDSNPLFTFTFEIPQGAQGIQGAQGPQGAAGPMGPRGYINLLRPNADACVAIGEGYMDESGNLQLLVSLDPKVFDNCGQIRGPQGYTGPQGPRGDAGYMSILRATAEDCVALGEGYMNSSGYLMILTDLDPRTFTNCGQLRGPQGSPGIQGPTGYVNIIRPNAESCTQLYDAYVDSNGNLQILTALPDTFTYGGRIKGDTGTAATIRVGTVATGDPGTDVIITNSGSSSAAVLNFTIPQGMPGEDVGINPVIPSGTPTSSLVAIKSGNDYYTVPQGETSLQFNVSIPAGETGTAIATIKDGQNYYTVPTKTSDLQNDENFSAVSGVNDGTNWTSITIDGVTKALGTGTGSANITFNPEIPSGTTTTSLTTIKDDNTDTYYSIAGGSGTANIEFNPAIPSGADKLDLFSIKDENTNKYYIPERTSVYKISGTNLIESITCTSANSEVRGYLAARTLYDTRSGSVPGTGSVGNAKWSLVDAATPAINFAGSKHQYNSSEYIYDDINVGNTNNTNWNSYKGSINDIYINGSIKTNRDPTKAVTVSDLVDRLTPAVETADKNKYLHTNEATGALEWAVAQDETIEANVQIPEGATVVELQNIKIGDVYYIMPGQTRYIVGNTLVDNSSTSSISNNTLTDNSVDINTTTNTMII